MTPYDSRRRDGGTTAISIAWEESEHVDVPGLFLILAETPERRLMVAALENGLRDLRYPGNNPNAQVIRHDARRWLMSEDASWPFSFLGLCEALGLSAEWIRRKVSRGQGERQTKQLHQVHRFGRAVNGLMYTHGKARGRPRTLRRTWR